MSTPTAHIIQRQVFELSTINSKTNFEWEKRATDYLNNIINPGIEACFKEVSLPGQHLIIDKLEIDLGSFTVEGFEKEAGKRLMEILISQLRSHRNAAEHGMDIMTQDSMQDAFSDRRKAAAKKETEHKPKLISSEKALQLALIYFLLYGRFPWWHRTNRRMPEEYSQIDWLQSLQQEERMELKEILENSKHARTRLANHFSAEWISALLQVTGLAGNEGGLLWHQLEQSIKKFPALLALFHQYFWLEWITTAGNRLDIVKVIEQTTGGNSQLAVELAMNILKIYRDATQSGSAGDYANYIPGSIEQLINDYLVHELTSGDLGATGSAHMIDGKLQTIDELLSELSDSDHKKSSEDKDEGFFVPAAGLVLLHPFLIELFSSTGLWNENTWANPNSWSRAVELLSYLSYGKEHIAESELVFHKLVVGIDAEIAIPADVPLSEQEIACCDELLQAVITHWKALRNTSHDGLREGFLQREAKITLADNVYTVHMERKAQDVLLSHLPWGYGIIKLPWLDKIMHVSWI